MKEILYWSPRKLEHFYLPGRKWGVVPSEVELSGLGASVRMASSPSIEGEEGGQFRKLARVAKHLTKKSAPLSELRRPWEVGDWFQFDYKMRYGRVANFSGEHAAIFYTSGIFEAGGLFLFGSAHHMVGEAPQATTHYTSALDWLSSTADHLEDDPDYVVGDGRRLQVYWELPRLALETTIRRLHRENKLLPAVRLSGLARILLLQPPCIWPNSGYQIGPLIVGSPLYVEIGPWNPKW
ncbi:SAVMC3_10250 family protein [Streptomyces sp. NPDC058665]|uniref:SAVMC3_10250 family protein n=1 Tax=Streptomyces sp. NPDC058665 TaxID=3346586 RepID=UPI003658F982